MKTKDHLSKQCMQLSALFDDVQTEAKTRGIGLVDAGAVIAFAQLFGTAVAPAPKRKPIKAKPVKRKPVKKARAKRRVPKGNSAGQNRAADGRRAVARGDRPPMREAMAIVMGKTTMGAGDVVAALSKRGWMPNAEDPQQYVSYMLSSNKETFERVERGAYKIRDGVVFSKKAPAGNGATAKPKASDLLAEALLTTLTDKPLRDTLVLDRIRKMPGLSKVTMAKVVAAATELTKAGKTTTHKEHGHHVWAVAV